jgi:LPXTG-motif cell wall-anchored protein
LRCLFQDVTVIKNELANSENASGGTHIMFRKQLNAKAVAALVAVVGLALAPLGASTATAQPYPPGAVTNAELTLEKNTVRPGEANTAYVRVTSDAGTPKGRVTFKVTGYQRVVVPLVDGEASYEMPRDMEAGKRYKVTARYNGTPVYRPSGDAEWVTVSDGQVAGEQGEAGRDGGETQEGTLPNVGADSTTQLYALAGLGLLGAGAAALLLHRRRRLEG